jgi:hypothetical protein
MITVYLKYFLNVIIIKKITVLRQKYNYHFIQR